MKDKQGILLCVLIVLFITGCAAHMTTYVPPAQPLVASEFYSIIIKNNEQEIRHKIEQAMRKFDWLQQTGDMTYAGRVANASQYVDCGRILTHSPSPVGHVEYASPSTEFMGMGTGSFDKLTTNLDVNISMAITPMKEGSKISVTAQYSLNREHVERRTMLGLESRPAEKNTPIRFDTFSSGSGGDGVMCRSRLSLEQSIIRAIAIQ